MPTYCFVCDQCGSRMEKFALMDRRPRSMTCAQCGTPCRRDYCSEQSGKSCGDTWRATGGFVSKRGETGSLSRAIHLDQIEEQMGLDKQKGVDVGIEWKPDGRGLARPHFSSKRARDRWDRAHGFVSE